MAALVPRARAVAHPCTLVHTHTHRDSLITATGNAASPKPENKNLPQAKREEEEPPHTPTVSAARRGLAPTDTRHPVGVQQKLDMAAALGPLVGVVACVLAAPIPVVAGHCRRQSTSRHLGSQPCSSPASIPSTAAWKTLREIPASLRDNFRSPSTFPAAPWQMQTGIWFLASSLGITAKCHQRSLSKGTGYPWIWCYMGRVGATFPELWNDSGAPGNPCQPSPGAKVCCSFSLEEK